MPEQVRWDVRHVDSVGSTNDYLMAEARKGRPEGSVVVAAHQTAGRGRRGRSWEAPPGSSLLMSVLLRPDVPPDALHLCSTAVGLAAADACAQVAGVTVGLKWPNDLVVGGRKLAGILAESDGVSSRPRSGPVAVVVGVGLNIDWPGPPEAGGTSLRLLGSEPVDRDELLAVLLEGLARRRALLDSADGRTRLLDELRSRCVTIGQSVRVTLATDNPATDNPATDNPATDNPATDNPATDTFEGTATGLDGGGRLLVLVGDDVRAVSAGDVVHLRPAPHGLPDGGASTT